MYNLEDERSDALRSRALALNVRFHELHYLRGIAKDVTNLGRGCNGDVEVGLTSLEELRYMLGLSRQAFEKQMGNGEAGE
jgi:predicted transport protein